MARTKIRDFHTMDKNFEPLNNAVLNEDMTMFNGARVEEAYNNSKKFLSEFSTLITEFGNKIVRVADAGLEGSSITIAINKYKDKMQQCLNRINETCNTYNKVVLDKINNISNAESASANLLNQIDPSGKIVGIKDVAMNEANDIISWAKGLINEMPVTPPTTNGVDYSGITLNSWANKK